MTDGEEKEAATAETAGAAAAAKAAPAAATTDTAAPEPPPAAAVAPPAVPRPIAPLDPRRNAYRPDLAAEGLEGRVPASRFTSGKPVQMTRPTVPLRRKPQIQAGLETEALMGETARLYDTAAGWAWIQLDRDGYVGYVPADALVEGGRATTHWVKALGTFVYPVPDFKAPPLMHLSLCSELTIEEVGDKFCHIAGGGFIARRHVAEKGRTMRDFVEIAERLIGTPYLWGGKTRIGLDCSGLVQISLAAAGIAAPRDSDMQEAELGESVLVPQSLDGLERGDLVFWPHHVGIMIDGVMMVHANAHHMSVVVETLPEAASRIARQGAEITAVKRLKLGKGASIAGAPQSETQDTATAEGGVPETGA